MKFNAIFLFAASASALSIAPRQACGGGGGTGTGTGATGLQRGSQTIVLKEVGGIAGNDCITFRNNGEMVTAACVNTAADRQVTPSSVNGQNVLAVQRSFSAGFRADLVNKQACVGFNGTAFLAQDCAAANLNPVAFTNGQLVSSSGACQNGHDAKAQVTVSANGQGCVRLTSTNVQATAP